MPRYIKPSPFHTFDPLRVDPLTLVEPILASLGGDHSELKRLAPDSMDIQGLKQGVEANFSPATLLFLASVEWGEGGATPEPIDRGLSRDRIGRFPIEGGNAIEYLLECTSQKSGEKNLHELLAKLGDGLAEENLGEAGFREAIGGMELLGWLTADEVTELRQSIQRGRWNIDADEPIDGGVQDAFRHLIILLKSAEKRRCGLLMRRHG